MDGKDKKKIKKTDRHENRNIKSEVKQVGLPVIAWLQLASAAMGKKAVCSIILKAVMYITLCWLLQVVAAPIFPKV